ncbi:ABC transporter permease [Glutamicibacter uratoxydans]|uniref:ABC transporter permease n=1 Tax=Glutamicibacter uratoxydans TaxID=43667 RepID=UPI003D6FECCB
MNMTETKPGTPASQRAGSIPVTTAATAPGTSLTTRLGHFLESYALVILTLLVIIFFSANPASSSAFPTMNNINVILGSQSVTALIAIAALFAFIPGHFDFSLGAVAVSTQVLSAGLMSFYQVPLWAAFLLSMVFAALIGVVNGYFVTQLKMNPFVTTLGMSILLTGGVTWFTGGKTILSGIDPAITRFGSTRILGLPLVFFVVLLIAAIIWYVLTHTPYGRSLYAIGSNQESAKLVGIRVERNVWVGFVLGSLIAGIAGIIQLSRMGSATASSGGDLLFAALAAVFLGATAITPGFFNVIGTLVGAIFVSISVSGLTLSGASGWASSVFNGAALLVAVGLSTYLGRRRKKG